MSSYNIPENKDLELLNERVQEAVDADTNDFNELVKILQFDPKTHFTAGDLSEFDLKDANLANADLHQTDFTQANMLDADLSNSNLKGANFNHTNLNKVDLTNTDLTGADLTDANLTDSNLSGAKLQNIKVTKATFRNIQGLSIADKKILEQQSVEIDDDLTDREQELQELIGKFCQHQFTPGTRKYNNTAYRVLAAIQKLPGLKRNYEPGLIFRQDYEEIFNDTLLEIIQKICPSDDPDCFQPKADEDYIKSLTNWINYKCRLYYKPKDLIRQNQHKPASLDRYINEGTNSTLVENLTDPLTLNGIDALIDRRQREHQERVREIVRDDISRDPDDKLKDCQSTKYPACNCYDIAQKRLLTDPPVSFRELAGELKMSMGTLTSYWYKNCIPKLQEIANQAGYMDE
jgi:Pentapeptide repeats (9 copies)